MDTEKGNIDKILDGCKRDDRKSQQQLYFYFYDALMNLCVRYTKSEEDAEEVCNAGYFKIFKNIQQYDSSKGALYTWVRTIMMNCCIQYLRLKQDILVAELNEAEEIRIEPEIDSKMSEAEILHLIRGLPPATRAVFNLYIIDGYGHKEIAGLLQISEGTSKWHLNAARKNLQSQLLSKRNSAIE